MKSKTIFLAILLSIVLSIGVFILTLKFNFYQYQKSDCHQRIENKLKECDQRKDMAHEYFKKTRDPSPIDRAESILKETLEFAAGWKKDWIRSHAVLIYSTSFLPFIFYLFFVFIFLKFLYRKNLSAKEIIKEVLKNVIFYPE